MHRRVALLSIMFLATGLTYPRRCLLYNKRCVAHCPRNMHPYDTRCDKDTLSQRTCKTPEIHVMGFTCGWSRCDCNGDKLLDETKGICVSQTECRLSYQRRSQSRRRKKKFRLSKRVKVKEEDEFGETFQ